MSVQALANHFCLGRRQFERRFLANNGLTASTFKRISRFEHALRALMLNDTGNTNVIALDHGYYDQAHFIHECKRQTGRSPEQYLKMARTKTHFYKTSLRKTTIMPIPDNI